MSPVLREPTEPIHLSRFARAADESVVVSLDVTFDHRHAGRALAELDAAYASLRAQVESEARIWSPAAD